MIKLEVANFRSEHLDCYEAVIINILRHLGLTDEAPLMGTQAYFVFRRTIPRISPRSNCVHDEWKRIHGLEVRSVPISNHRELHDQIVSKIAQDMPLGITVDIYHFPHTSYHGHIHHLHYVNVFGYDENQYYIVCPYYGFAGWLDMSLIRTSFFSPVIQDPCCFFVPELMVANLTSKQVRTMILESCRNMLGLTIPEELAGESSESLGLAGIRSFATFLEDLITSGTVSNDCILELSRQLITVGDSRYWLHRLVETCRERLVPERATDDLVGGLVGLAKDWRVTGLLLGASTHAQQAEKQRHKAKRAVDRFEHLYTREKQLFGGLLSVLDGQL